jgi:opacity protein-like surface antigen
VTLLLTCGASAQDWNLTGAGARAEGFGGAFIGIADDATAIVWNPAGLGQLERTEVSAVARYIMETSEFTSHIPGDLYSVSNSQSHFNFNFASLAVPFTVGGANVVLAAAYQTQLDFYAKSTDVNKNETETTGAATTVTPGIAIRFGSVFSVGAAANIWMGSYDYTAKLTSGDIQTVNPTFSGLNFGGGVFLDFSGLSTPIPLRLGLAVKTPFTLKADVEYTVNASPGQANFDVEMPLMIGAGASLRIGQNFTLAADYEMRQFKDKKYTTTEQDYSESGLLSDSNEDLNQVRVGAEYLFVMKGGVIPLRAGFRTTPTVYANYQWNRTSGEYDAADQVSGFGYSAGTGFISSSFALDFAYTREKYDEQTWTDQGVTDFSNTYHVDRFSLSLIIYF